MKNFRLPKWAIIIVAAVLFLALSVDWVAPGSGALLAVEWLGGVRQPSELFPLWGWLVRHAGRDIVALGWISLGAGLVCVWLVAMIFGSIFGAAVRKARDGGSEDEARKYLIVENVAVLIAALSFALTPGLLRAATRVSPLMTSLAPLLAIVAILISVLAGGTSSCESKSKTVGERLRKAKGRLLLVVALIAYSAYELIFARRAFIEFAFPALWAYLAIGVLPAFVLAWCVRRRWLVTPKSLGFAFGAWTLAVLVMGIVNFTAGSIFRGRDANRLVARIIANSEESGKIAIASDGALDEFLFFMLPEKMRLISMAREYDPAYGRELSDWVRASKTNLVEDLSFAAELGPRALIDEWVRLDESDFEASVATVQNFFPTREKWDEACAMLAEMRVDEPFEPYLRLLLGKAAQEAIHKAIREGKVRIDLIGGQLITIDLALGDIESAEKDAIEVLRHNRHDPSANATLGALAGQRGDHERAERYLRRALATGRASIAAKNDLAYLLYRMGRFDEAEPLAREAIAAYGESWNLHETLAAILLRKGEIAEGEKELVRAEELAAKAGFAKGKIASLAIDRRATSGEGGVDGAGVSK